MKRAVRIGINISGRDIYATEDGLKWRNGRSTSPSMFMVFFTKGEKRRVRKALASLGRRDLVVASIPDKE